MSVEVFDKHTAANVRNEYINFIDVLCSNPGGADEHFVLTFDSVRKGKPVRVTSIATDLLLVNTEALLFKCKGAEASLRHAVNWDSSFKRDQQPRRMPGLSGEGGVLELLEEKARNVKQQEERRLVIHRYALHLLACYYVPKL